MTTMPASFVVVSGLKPESLKFSSSVTLRITKTFNQRKPGCKHRFNCRTSENENGNMQTNIVYVHNENNSAILNGYSKVTLYN